MKTLGLSLVSVSAACILLAGCNLVHDLSGVWDDATFDDRLSGRWGKEDSSLNDRQFMFIPKDGLHESFDLSQNWLNSLEKDDKLRVVSNLISYLDYRQVRSYEYQGKLLLLSKRIGDNRGEVFAYSITNGVLNIRTLKPEILVDAIKQGQVKGSILSESSISTYFTFPNGITPKEMFEVELIGKAIDSRPRPNDSEQEKSAILNKLDTDTLDYIASNYDNEDYWTALDPLHKYEDADGKWITYFQSVDCMSIINEQIANTALEMGITNHK